jgi:hypothetical protein
MLEPYSGGAPMTGMLPRITDEEVTASSVLPFQKGAASGPL